MRPELGSSTSPTPAAENGSCEVSSSSSGASDVSACGGVDVVGSTVAAVSAHYRRMFLDGLSTIEGLKLFILEDSLACPLSHLIDAHSLQQHGVERCFALAAFPISLSAVPAQTARAPTVVFVCRARLSRLPLILRHINFIEQNFPQAQPPPAPATTATAAEAAAATSGTTSARGDPVLLWQFHLPPIAAKSGRRYVVVLLPESSEFIVSEFRRLLSAPTATNAHAEQQQAGHSSLPAAAAALISNLGNSLLPVSANNATQDSTDFSSSSSSSVSPDCVAVTHCPIQLFPVERDVLSLELPNFFRAYHGQGDVFLCKTVANAIDVLQQQQQQHPLHQHPLQQPKQPHQRLIPHLRCIGSAAKAVSDFLIQKRKQQQQQQQRQVLQRFDDPCLGGHLETQQPSPPPVPPVYSVLDAEDCGASPPFVSGGSSLLRFATAEEAEAGEGAWVAGSSKSSSLSLPHAPHMAVLFDRRVDLITPLCTDFTYQGLLDSTLGIEGAGLEVPKHLLQQQQQQQQEQQEQQHSFSDGVVSPLLSSSSGSLGVSVLIERGRGQRVPLSGDSLFKSLRDLHQTEVGAVLHRIASEIKETYRLKDRLRTIQDISSFMVKFKLKQQEHASLSLHVKLASFIAAVSRDPNYHSRLCLEDRLLQGTLALEPGLLLLRSSSSNSNSITELFEKLIDESAATEAAAASGCCSAAATTLDEVYRLLCLYSVTAGGIKAAQLKPLLHALVQQHGTRELRRVASLQQVGLLREQNPLKKTKASGGGNAGPEAWKFVREKCKLMVDEQSAMTDIAYVCSGYAPLSVRYAMHCCIENSAARGNQLSCIGPHSNYTSCVYAHQVLYVQPPQL